MARNSFYEGTVADAELIANASEDARLAEEKAAAAAASATSAAASYDSFDDRYLGTKSSNPSVDNDGATLLDGALYFNTSNNVMMVYDLGNTSWVRTTPTTTEQGHINTVSGIAANVSTVAGVSGNVTTVAGISSNVTSVAGNATNINAVAADATDIGAVAGKATEIGRLGTADAVADMAILGTSAIVADMAILGTADVVADMNVLGTADVVADMNTLGTADVVADLNTLGTADVVADLNTLGTADVVTDMNTLGTGANVTNMATLGASGVVGNIATVAGISSDVTTVAGKATEIGRLGTADAVADLAVLGTADVVADLNTLGTADVVSDMNTLGTADNVTNMNTVADNIAGVNSFADRYRVASSAPTGSLDEGDLYFNTTDNKLYYYNDSAWVEITSSSYTHPNHTGDVTSSGDGALTIANDAVDSQHYAAASIDNEHLADDAVGIAELSATGTAGNTTFLRGDNAWVVPTDTNTTYTAGTGITLSGTEFSAAPLALTTVQTAANQSAHLALTTEEGDVVVRSDENKSYVHNGGTAGTMGDFTLLATPTDAVLSVNSQTGAITAAHIKTAYEANSDTNEFSDAEQSKLAGIAASANNYTHPTSDGNKHIPSGGAAGQILRYASAGTAAWGADENDAVAMAIALG